MLIYSIKGRLILKNFKKLDEAFKCVNCGKDVMPLGYTSRNHCPYCLHSLHVDINPGDRANPCKGVLKPIGLDTKKGEYVIVFKCSKCGVVVRNKVAVDDNYQEILNISTNGKI